MFMMMKLARLAVTKNFELVDTDEFIVALTHGSSIAGTGKPRE